MNSMVEAFETTEGHLSLRLMAALEAGQAAGGDRRGMQSAAMLIVKEAGGVWLNNDVVLRLQVDDSEEPIAELRRLVEIAARRRERVRGRWTASRRSFNRVSIASSWSRAAFSSAADGISFSAPRGLASTDIVIIVPSEVASHSTSDVASTVESEVVA